MENAKIENSTATFWVAKSSLKMPKTEACVQTVLPDKNWLKMPKISNEIFLAIFKQCEALKLKQIHEW